MRLELAKPKIPQRDDENGLHSAMSREDYDALERVSWSRLKEMETCPARFKHNLTVKDDRDTDAMQLGRCVHLAVLEPERFKIEVEVWEGEARRGEEWAAFKEAHADKEILRQSDYFLCAAIQRAVRATEAAKQYLEGGPAELSILWTHEAPTIGGLPGYRIDMKSRLDFLAKTAIVDLKTCVSARPDDFGRAAHRLGYHRQAAVYADAYEHATGKRLPFVIVAVEKTPPHAVQVYRVPDALVELGRQDYRALLDRLHVCQRDNHWPGYAEGELDLELPRWAMPQEDEEDLSESGLTFAAEG